VEQGYPPHAAVGNAYEIVAIKFSALSVRERMNGEDKSMSSVATHSERIQVPLPSQEMQVQHTDCAVTEVSDGLLELPLEDIRKGWLDSDSYCCS
jgi:hypothetical protein